MTVLIERLEWLTERLKEARADVSVIERKRDDLILEALASGHTERPVARAANVTRGWIWKLKLAYKEVEHDLTPRSEGEVDRVGIREPALHDAPGG